MIPATLTFITATISLIWSIYATMKDKRVIMAEGDSDHYHDQLRKCHEELSKLEIELLEVHTENNLLKKSIHGKN